MHLDKECIVDIKYILDKGLEANLLECFLDVDDIILFPWYEENLNGSYETQSETSFNINKFAIEREVFRCSEKIFPWFEGLNGNSIWYSPINREELIDILKFEGITYCCCIIKKGFPLCDFSYVFWMYEHHEVNDYEYRSLFFYENGNKNFSDKVMPKLNRIFSMQ